MKNTFYQDHIKRKLDIALSAASLPVLLPLVAGISAAIELDDPGPVFFIQKRVGKSSVGRIHYFPILKFRTMRTDTPHDVPTHLLKDPDQYITRVGRILRKTSLDELPQIFNIIGGDMSVIGPRPALWNQKDLIHERNRYGANAVTPGLTGWAQCNGRDELSIEEKAAYDGYYVEHLSFGMDVRCFLKSIAAVLEEKGQQEGKKEPEEKKTEEKEPGKKILLITNHSYMFWQFRRELVQELLDEGYELYLATPFNGHEDDFKTMGCHVIRTDLDRRGVNPKAEGELFKKYFDLMKTIRPDLVVTYSIKPNLYGGVAAQLLHIPYCTVVQGLGTAFERPAMAKAASALYSLACRKAGCVFFENERNADFFVRNHIVKKGQTKVLRGAGVNLDFFTYTPKKELEASAVDGAAASQKPFHFLYLGRIMKEKGMDELFYAVRKLKRELNEGELSRPFILDLVGFFEEEYEHEVKELEEEGIVHFYGFQKDPRPFYRKADAVVLPSYHEGMSNVLLEAASTGRVLITSAIPGCRETVDQGRTGFLCRPKDGESLYRVMRHVLTLPTERIEAMGRAGRLKMEQEFDRCQIVSETIGAMKETIL